MSHSPRHANTPAEDAGACASEGGAPQDAAAAEAERKLLQRIGPLVGDIRQRVRTLTGRDAALRRRELEIEQRCRTLQIEAKQVAERALAQAQDQFLRREAELKQQAAHLDRHAARLTERQQRSDEQLAEDERRREAAQQEWVRLQGEMAAVRAQLAQERTRLRSRARLVRRRERALAQERNSLEFEQTRGHEALIAAQLEVDQLQANLNRQQSELQQQREALEQELTALRRQAAELESGRSDFGATEQEVLEQRAALARAASELSRTEQNLRAREAALVEQQRAFDQQRLDLARTTAAQEAQARELASQEATWRQREQRLQEYDEQLSGRAAALETEAQRLRDVERALQQSQAAVAHEHESGQQEIERRRQELTNAQQALHERDVQLRQNQLALELERQEVAREREALTSAGERLDETRAVRREELERVREALADEAAGLRSAQSLTRRGPGRPLVRSLVLAGLAGAAAIFGWLSWERPLYESAAVLTAPHEVIPAAEVLAPLALRLQTPSQLAEWLPDEPLAAAWQSAADADAATASWDAREGALLLRVRSLDRTAALDLAERMARALAGLAEQSPAVLSLESRFQELRRQRDELAARLAERQPDAAALRTRLAPLIAPAAISEQRTALNVLRERYQKLTDDLTTRRNTLIAQESGPVPRGTVLPSDLQTGLANDEMYQEDTRQFRATGLEHRSELAVAMLLSVDPAKALNRTVADFLRVLGEQQGLQPPPEIAALLESVQAELEALQAQLEAFTPAWSAAVAEIQALVPERQSVELVRQQQAATERARNLLESINKTLHALRTQIDEAGQALADGTRAVVVGAVLRDELTEFTAAAGSAIEALRQADLAHNFRLEALERQLRGLSTRLERRQSTMQAELQFAADEAARQVHIDQIARLRTAALALEQEREATLLELSTALDELRAAEDELAQRRGLEVELAQLENWLAARQQELDELERQIAAQAARLPTDAAVEVARIDIELAAGRQRVTHAALAGLSAAGLMFAFCWLMVLPNPLRRRAEWEKALQNKGGGF